MENQIYHLVYLTTNLINGKIYVGVHSTYKLEDGYLGSGKAIRKAIKKYGKENFKREILYFCLTACDALEIEELIVDKKFIRGYNYNLMVGGLKGPSYPGQDNPGSKTKMSEEKRKSKGKKSIETRISNGQIKSGEDCNFSKAKMSQEEIHQKNLKSAQTLKEKIANGYKHKGCEQSPKMIAISNKGEIIEFQGKRPFANKYKLNVNLITKFLNKGPVLSNNRNYKSPPTEEYLNTIGWEFKTI